MNWRWITWEKKIKNRRGDNRANATGHPANVPPLTCSRDKQTFELNVCDDTDPSSPVLYGDEEEVIQCSQACADAGRCLCSKCWSGKSYSSSTNQDFQVLLHMYGKMHWMSCGKGDGCRQCGRHCAWTSHGPQLQVRFRTISLLQPHSLRMFT